MDNLHKLNKPELIRFLRESQEALASDREEEKRILHSLQTHQIELELQNRELRRMQNELEVSRDLYADLYDFAPVGYMTLDLRGLILEINLTASISLGLPRNELIGRPIASLLAKESVQSFFRHLKDANHQTNQNAFVEIGVRSRSKGVSYFRMESSPRLSREGRSCLRSILIDITEKKQTESQMRLAFQVIENTQEGVLITDRSARIVSVNPAFEQLTGYAAQETLGRKPSLLKSGYHDEDFYRKLWQELNETGRWQGEIWNRRKNAEVFPEWLNISTIRNDEGIVSFYIGVFSDISTQKQIQEHLRYLAYYDTLTNLPNRHLFQDRLKMSLALARREMSKLAIMFIDVDRFKSINDSLGHTTGDTVLKEMAARITATLRQSDTTSRLGGDEFTIILNDIKRLDSVANIATKLLKACGQPLPIDGHILHVTISIGISIYPEDGETEEDLLKHADTAMYRAKATGRGKFLFYNPEMGAWNLERLKLEQELRVALEKNQIYLAFQPQLDLDTGRCPGIEVLARWNHPTLGEVPPTVFIPLAEELGLIDEIGKWVLRNACLQQKAWIDAGLDPGRIAVNFSAFQMQRGNPADTISRILKETGLPPTGLEIEVTESIFMGFLESTISVLQMISEQGVEISVDDFGTGYSSLSYLKLLPINKLKIDQSFVKDLPEDSNATNIVTAIIAMARALGLRVVAEGVEKEEQKEFLRKEGCGVIQGYLHSHPVSAKELEALLIAEGPPYPETRQQSELPIPAETSQ